MTRILDPTLRPAAPAATAARASRPKRFDGLTIGLLANGKSNGMALLERVVERLTTRHAIVEVVRVAKTNASAPVSESDAEMLARRCGAVITAIGD